jgi:maltose/moltooligosaccharide transporter
MAVALPSEKNQLDLGNKPRMSFWQIINMNVGFFGIQYSFGLQQSAVNPIYDMLGASPDQIPFLNLAGPMTGLLIQPIIGAMSDKTWHPKFGRRKPYFLVGALVCSIALFFYPFSSSLWMAAGLLWILDAGNNTAMEPYRAFVADKLNSDQQATGFQSQSFFTGLGQTLANLSLFIFPMIFIGKTGKLPTWVFASFMLGAVCSIGSIWWSMRTTPEIPPTDSELEEIKAYNAKNPHPIVQLFASLIILLAGPILLKLGLDSLAAHGMLGFSTDFINLLLLPGFFGWIYFLHSLIENRAENRVVAAIKSFISPFMEIVAALKEMPKIMWQLALVYLFQWYALFCYWQNSAKSIAQSVYKTTPADNPALYEEAVGWTGLVNSWYNIVTFLCAFGLVWFANKYSPKWVHTICLVLAAIGFLLFPHIENKYLLFPVITGFGIGWASMMGIPYLMVVHGIPKERYGVYMGIINMMIVVPMLIQNLTFGYIHKHFLSNNPGSAITFAGVLLLIAACCTLLIRTEKVATAK